MPVSNPTQLDSGGINPKNIVWIFGTARVGSTWLSAMMADLKGHQRWEEPLVGELFGHYFYYRGLRWNDWNAPWHRNDGGNFIFSPSHKKTWLSSIRSFVLDGARARFTKISKLNYLIIQEPNGSIGAPWLMEALPESRIVFLIRDPRDIVASLMDAYRKGGWAYEEEYEYLIDHKRYQQHGAPDSPADNIPDSWVEELVDNCVLALGNSKQAYDNHRGYKVLVRYEDLRLDTLGTMNHIYTALEISVNEEELARVVDKHAWENIPKDRKGKGKILRKAIPGGWRQDLAAEQVEMVETKAASLIKEFYFENRASSKQGSWGEYSAEGRE